KHPLFFSKHAKVLAGPFDPITLPSHSLLFDNEVELGVLIGASIPWRATPTPQQVEDALYGYVLLNDLTSRRFLIDDNGALWRGKNLPNSTSVGPLIIPISTMKHLTNFIEPGTPNLTLSSSIARKGPCQHGTTEDMIFTVAELINELLKVTPLEPGDLIFTGTPGGTGFRISKLTRLLGRITDGKFKGPFIKKQEQSTGYLRVGDEVTIAGDWLGTQHFIIQGGNT
ncbi:MAG TPA: fumarylacetoacetate hydrolase family protein, partial [Bdellovibrionota bacterium]|nr:fumarylacetoacetate hydrolase family protein [Bdellovibrionota bacterium]